MRIDRTLPKFRLFGIERRFPSVRTPLHVMIALPFLDLSIHFPKSTCCLANHCALIDGSCRFRSIPHHVDNNSTYDKNRSLRLFVLARPACCYQLPHKWMQFPVIKFWQPGIIELPPCHGMRDHMRKI